MYDRLCCLSAQLSRPGVSPPASSSLAATLTYLQLLVVTPGGGSRRMTSAAAPAPSADIEFAGRYEISAVEIQLLRCLTRRGAATGQEVAMTFVSRCQCGRSYRKGSCHAVKDALTGVSSLLGA